MKLPSLSMVLGWRFLRAKQRNHYLSFISASSALGIAIGVAAIIIVLSAMNGFEKELKNRLLAVFPQVELTAVEQPLNNWHSYATMLTEQADVEAVAPFIRFAGLLGAGNHLKFTEIRGIEPKWEYQVSRYQQFISGAKAPLATSGSIVVGKTLADALGVKIGDKVSVLVQQPGKDFDKLLAPKQQLFTLTGIFHFGGQLDGQTAYVGMDDARKLAGYPSGVQGLRLKVSDPLRARTIADRAAEVLPFYSYVSDWTRAQGHVYQDIQMVRLIVYLVMVLVAAVASFNIVSTLVLAVQDKQSSIAILMTMGASTGTILRSFMIQGTLNGLSGTLLGVGLGCFGAYYLGDIMAGIEALIGHQLLSANIYFINFIPTELRWHDVAITATVAMVTSILATLYPALRASKTEPAKALSHA